MTSIGPNTQMGIELAQQGQKVEALAYLRRAVTTEPLNAEVWLWLAHVTPDLNEYRNCIHQALVLQPDHPTAQRMQQDISYQSYGAPPPVMAAEAAQTMSRTYRRQSGWRRILIVLNIIVVIVACGFLSRLGLERLDEDDLNAVIPFLASTKTIQFAVGGEDDAISFRVDVPESWYLADEGSSSWRAERDRLQAEFPPDVREPNIWRNMETDLGAVQRSAATGEFEVPITILETRSDRIRNNLNAIPAMRLIAIQTLPDEYPDNNCGSLRLLEESETAAEISSFIESEVRERAAGDCVYVTHYSRTDSEDVTVRLIRLSIPIEDDQLAQWQITIPKSLYTRYYQESVDAIIDSLTYVTNP